jgi:hypothetical protein
LNSASPRRETSVGLEQAAHFAQVVAVAEAERGRAEQVAARPGSRLAGRVRHRRRQVANDLVEGLGRAPVLFLLVRGQLQGHHRDRQREGLRETTGVVLDELGGAGRADDHRLRLESLVGLAGRGLEQLGGVAAQVARLEGGVGDRRAARQPLDHREQQVGVGVALRRVQHVVQLAHRGRDPHRADVRRSFVGPERELHDEARQATSFARRSSGREKSSARSAAWS